MKQRLILISDLWGQARSNWIHYYQASLESDFEVQYYDCCQLAGIDVTNLKEEAIHSQFVKNGINTAVQRLIKLEKGKVSILAFSIGGTIAWKAGLSGLEIEYLYAISSTRLRYETNKPNCGIKLYYGEKDRFKPDSEWLKNLGLDYKNTEDGDHLIYTDQEFSREVCKEIKRHFNNGTSHTLR